MFAEHIRMAMYTKKMSQKTLAQALGFSEATMSNKMKRDYFTSNELKILAKTLGCSASFTLIETDTGKEF